ncbi:phosphate ABC transporter substrate-binding protein PstS [Haloechinothrix sp. LS1_15]|uniref:phosphate ABC transporter substrate-binding protein PstS n=1 Tax=Haloechinothrix sp. LS1_15 TaxID=2652248 RepID=UPI00294B7E6D|nr:phosphate ABC transporter substrate-binding protein PstS [Haloechinothrix sp. LS1_15]
MRRGTVACAVTATLALTLAACGSDDNIDQTGIDIPEIECTGKSTINASGSTAQANAMTRFINIYESACPGFSVNYNSSGSGAGVSEFLGAQTHFAGTDIPLQEQHGEVADARERCGGNEAWNLPLVFGPIAITYHLEGVEDLVLDGPAIAQIFNGSITSWDDEYLAELNEGTELPDEDITVIFRSDESGTTENFQRYLRTAAPDHWEQGVGKVFQGGVGEGASGNENTSSAVTRTPGSITYNEWSFAKQHGLQTADVINSGGGEPVPLSDETAARAIDAAEIAGQGHDLELDLDSIYGTEQPGAYPLMLASYEVVCSRYPDGDVSDSVQRFLHVAATYGQQGLAEAGFTPLPEAFQERLVSSIEAIS